MAAAFDPSLAGSSTPIESPDGLYVQLERLGSALEERGRREARQAVQLVVLDLAGFGRAAIMTRLGVSAGEYGHLRLWLREEMLKLRDPPA